MDDLSHSQKAEGRRKMDDIIPMPTTALPSQLGYHEHHLDPLDRTPYDYYEARKKEDRELMEMRRQKKDGNFDRDIAHSLVGKIDTRDQGARARHTSREEENFEATAHKIRDYVQKYTSSSNLSRRAVPFYEPANVQVRLPHTALDAHMRMMEMTRHLLSDVDHETRVSFVDEVIEICKEANKPDHTKLREIKDLLPNGYKEEANHDILLDLMTLAEGVIRLADVIENAPQPKESLGGWERENPPEDVLADEDPPKVFGRTPYVRRKGNRFRDEGVLLMGDVQDDYEPENDELRFPGGEPEYMDVPVE